MKLSASNLKKRNIKRIIKENRFVLLLYTVLLFTPFYSLFINSEPILNLIRYTALLFGTSVAFILTIFIIPLTYTHFTSEYPERIKQFKEQNLNSLIGPYKKYNRIFFSTLFCGIIFAFAFLYIGWFFPSLDGFAFISVIIVELCAFIFLFAVLEREKLTENLKKNSKT